ncbi:uncharacterized protein (TIGR02246 family) [Saccharopolyspora erythraea NRRL 2338]|uniref:Hydrolase n=1 Tax=Saccharopolyspora erythraea (strain ATCC 11635 / DSM 40517 / JCM 4748 / NBRC 13426 / NCIMB 8594 / NRRL 2338) TaxID=405948 RepID=A4F6N1_SACEN|nr:DUF4440 domain-containing protein [Saccharopolyspora erythraea]PFG93508.1 uncharacterized protein (TIGR02246 family) [Saccharopolyspora erythraea NRRL 2338]QRK90369.1 DUF4440 domain-containing protein [Saccharopolyspora erythraea]CAL99705.1 putative hydrolase [Saccharopolyspora erythraea NRRL 2338]
MTTDHDNRTAPFRADDPAQHAAAYVAAFNSGDREALDQVYEDAAVLVPVPGHPVTGAERAAAAEHLLGLGLPIQAAPRHVYVAGDIALLIVDWSIRGTAPDGTEVDMAGTATDVARRGADGRWRYVIDNPHGTAWRTFARSAIPEPEGSFSCSPGWGGGGRGSRCGPRRSGRGCRRSSAAAGRPHRPGRS